MGDGQKQEQCILIIMVILGTVCYFYLLFNMQECFQLSIPLLCWIGCSMLYNTMSASSACTALCQPVDSFPVFCTKYFLSVVATLHLHIKSQTGLSAS